MSDTKQTRAERQRLRQKYGPLFDEVVGILFKYDPLAITFATNKDEYEPEATTILQRIDEATSADDLRRIVHEVFVRWFDEAIAGPASWYSGSAAEIWAVWQRCAK